MKLNCTKTLQCEGRECERTITLTQEDNVTIESLQNKARDSKWDRIRDAWFCPSCRTQVVAVLHSLGLTVHDSCVIERKKTN